jgi:hypothetical protein
VNRARDAAERRAFADAASDAERGVRAAAALRRPEIELRGRLVRSYALVNAGRYDEALDEANA